MLGYFLYYGAPLVFPLWLWGAWKLRSAQGWGRIRLALALLLAIVFLYARYIEPRILGTHTETILLPGASETSPTIRIVLFADPHHGLFGHAMPMARITRRINAQKPDAVLIAGDYIYHPRNGQIEETIARLSEINAPIYAILGNHDVGIPGTDYTGPIEAALEAAGVNVLTNEAQDVTLGGHKLIIAGITDFFQGRQDFSFVSSLPPGEPVLLLTHNPDTALNAPDSFAYDLMLAGHTHGAQVRIPGLVHRTIPTKYPFDKGLHIYPSGGGKRLVYVTPGTGMAGVPLRLNMPPRIDVLTIHLPE